MKNQLTTALQISKLLTVSTVIKNNNLTTEGAIAQYRDVAYAAALEFGASTVELLKFVRLALEVRYPELGPENFKTAKAVLEQEGLL